MPPPDDLDDAVVEGIITADQAARLRGFLVGRGSFAAPDPDAEAVRFVRGFHDVFLAIGVAVLCVGTTFAGVLSFDLGAVLGPALAGVVIWGLAEVFARRRRLVLPSIVLAVGFTLVAAFLSAGLEGVFAGAEPAAGLADDWSSTRTGLLAAGGGIVGALVFYARFRLPFALGAAAAAAVAGLAVAVIGFDLSETDTALAFFAAGIALFAAAMAFDMRDPERRGLDADRAFWLHLVAAPAIVHSVIGLAGVRDRFELGFTEAVVVLVVVVALGLVALLVDRRALLVSGLGYLGFAIGRVVQQTAMTDDAIIAVTLVVLGLFIVLLGAGWRTARRGVLALVPSAALKARLPAAA